MKTGYSSLAWACLLVAGCGLVIGFASRASAIGAWFLHLCAAKSGGFVSYGMDNFMTIGAILFDVVAAAGPVFTRLATARFAT